MSEDKIRWKDAKALATTTFVCGILIGWLSGLIYIGNQAMEIIKNCYQ